MCDILYGNIVSCSTAMMSPSLPPPERAVPIVTIVTTDNVQECGEHRFGVSNTLMLAWNARGFGGLLRRPRSAPVKLTTCHRDVRDCLKILVFKLI